MTNVFNDVASLARDQNRPVFLFRPTLPALGWSIHGRLGVAPVRYLVSSVHATPALVVVVHFGEKSNK